MSDLAFYSIVGGTVALLLLFVFCAFAVAGRADDAEQQARQQRAYGDCPNIPHGLTEAASCPGDATCPHTGVAGEFAQSFHSGGDSR